jgi:hypothetical protein
MCIKESAVCESQGPVQKARSEQKIAKPVTTTVGFEKVNKCLGEQ